MVTQQSKIIPSYNHSSTYSLDTQSQRLFGLMKTFVGNFAVVVFSFKYSHVDKYMHFLRRYQARYPPKESFLQNYIVAEVITHPIVEYKE